MSNKNGLFFSPFDNFQKNAGLNQIEPTFLRWLRRFFQNIPNRPSNISLVHLHIDTSYQVFYNIWALVVNEKNVKMRKNESRMVRV